MEVQIQKPEDKLSSPEACLVNLQVFQGPLDLLLHLIKKNEVDIYDIPVSLIAEQYLGYLDLMKELKLEVVGDYLVMAAELGLIKSKMLLPEPEIEDEGDVEDPRAELVRRIIEYQRYRDAAQELAKGDVLGRDVFIRGYKDEEFENEPDIEMEKIDLWTLIDAFREVYKRRNYLWTGDIRIDVEAMTLETRMTQIIDELRSHHKLLFYDLFSESASRFDIILTFLALLELVRTGSVSLSQEEPFQPIQLLYAGDESLGS